MDDPMDEATALSILDQAKCTAANNLAASEKCEPKRLTPSAIPMRSHRIADDIARDKSQQEKVARWQQLVAERGKRYASCLLSNFACDCPKQSEAVSQLTEHCRMIRERSERGEGVVLFGPRGTGKDHLAMAVCRAAIQAGMTVKWLNGADFFADMRDRIGSHETERQLVHQYVRPNILYFSDPLPPLGVLTEFQATTLFRILDARYSQMRPIIATVNVSGSAELDARIGPQNSDRLRDGALTIYCDWPSHRRSKR